MKRSLLVVTTAVALMASANAHAGNFVPEESDHPIRLATYPVFFLGKVLETVVVRPIHYVANQPKLRFWFGTNSNPRTDKHNIDMEHYQRY